MTKLGNPRWHRLLSWALRLSSPSKALIVAELRKPILERHLMVDEDDRVVGIEPSEVRFEDGLLTLREAWTGEIQVP